MFEGRQSNWWNFACGALQLSKTANASVGLEGHIEPSTMKIDDAFYVYFQHWLCLTWQSNRILFLEWMTSWFSSSEGVVNWNISVDGLVSVFIPWPVRPNKTSYLMIETLNRSKKKEFQVKQKQSRTSEVFIPDNLNTRRNKYLVHYDFKCLYTCNLSFLIPPESIVPFKKSTYRPRWKSFHDLVKDGREDFICKLFKVEGTYVKNLWLFERNPTIQLFELVFLCSVWRIRGSSCVCGKMGATSVCPALLIADSGQQEQQKIQKKSWNKHETNLMKAKTKTSIAASCT